MKFTRIDLKNTKDYFKLHITSQDIVSAPTVLLIQSSLGVQSHFDNNTPTFRLVTDGRDISLICVLFRSRSVYVFVGIWICAGPRIDAVACPYFLNLAGIQSNAIIILNWRPEGIKKYGETLG